MEKNTVESNTTMEQDRAQLCDLVDKTLQLASDLGASAAEVGASIDTGLSATVRMREVETIEFNRDKGLSITVYFGHRRGMASTSDTSSDALNRAVKAACDIAKVSDEDPCFGLADAALMKKIALDLDLYHPWSLGAEDALSLALSCESQALDHDPRIVNSDGCTAASYTFLRAYGNSHGFTACTPTTRHSLSCVLVAQDDKGLQRDYDYTSVRIPVELWTPERVAKQAAERTLRRLNPRKVKTQNAPVVFSAEVASSLIGSFIAAISGGNLYRKSSFLTDALGKMVFSPQINIYEQPHLPQAMGSAAYDSEGVITRDNHFVKAGQLNSYVLGSYSARRLGLQTTANAGGVFNLTVDNDDICLAGLLKQMDKGLLVTSLMGQGVNLLTGDYSRGASGFWVENGEIQYPVDEITIAGRLPEMFKGVLAVANDTDPRRATRCGSLLVDQMMVAGD